MENKYNLAETVVILVVLISMVVFSLFGNVLTIVAYFKVKSLQTATNYFILSLATADIIVALFVVNIHTMYMVIDWPYHILNYKVCLLWLTVDYWVFQVSVFGVLLIAGDRYLCVKFPLKYRTWRTDRVVVVANAANWIISFLIWVPMILYYGYSDNIEEEMVANSTCDVGSAKIIPATVVGCIVSYVLPVFLMLACAGDSVRIMLRMKHKFSTKKKESPKQKISVAQETALSNASSVASIAVIPERLKKDSTATLSNEEEQVVKRMWQNTQANYTHVEGGVVKRRKDAKNNNNNNNRARRMSTPTKLDDYQWIATFNVLLGITFTVNVFPFGILAVTRSVCLDITGESCVSTKWWYFGYIMCYLNSLLNPVCYAVGNKNFKRAFKELLCTRSKEEKTVSYN